MVGALNKLPVAASGLIFFGDPVTFSSVTGIFTGFVAGLVYAIAKQTQSKNSTPFFITSWFLLTWAPTDEADMLFCFQSLTASN